MAHLKDKTEMHLVWIDPFARSKKKTAFQYAIYECEHCKARRAWGCVSEGHCGSYKGQAIWLACSADCGVTKHHFIGFSNEPPA